MTKQTGESRSIGGISLRTRLTVWVIAIFVVIQSITGIAFWYYQHASVTDLFEQRFAERAKATAAEIERLLPGLSVNQLDTAATQQLGDILFVQFVVDVVDAAGNSVVTGQQIWPERVLAIIRDTVRDRAPQRGRLSEEESGFDLPIGQHAELIALPLEADRAEPLVFIVVASDAFIARQMALVARVLIAGGLFGVLASLISGWFIAGIAVEPIHRLGKLTNQLRPENLDQEILLQTGDAEMQELSEELRETREQLRDAFRAQERFLSNISHELKTPIATLLTQAQTMDRSSLPDHAVDFVESAEDEMRKLGRLVESFLTLTRVRDGGGVVHPKPYPANELVMDAVADCTPMAEQHAVRLIPSLAVSGDCPDVELRGDPALLITMLNNLIRNAIKFSPRHGRVRVNAESIPGAFRISVLDEGPGMSDDVLVRVFDRFVQGGTESTRERGHGLGLAIAKGIAELHNGDIRAENRNGSGAAFIITLPCDDQRLDGLAGATGTTTTVSGA